MSENIVTHLFEGQSEDVSLQFEKVSQLFSSKQKLQDVPKGDRVLTLLKGGYGPKGRTKFNFGLNYGSDLRIEIVNRSNPAKVSVPIDKGGKEKGISAWKKRPSYPWSYGSAPSSIVYRLKGFVKGGIDTSNIAIGTGATGRFGVQGSSQIVTSYVHVHGNSTTLGSALRGDLIDGGFRFSLNPNQLAGLVPNKEFLMTEFEGGLGFSASASWGQVFRSDPGLLQGIFKKGCYLDLVSPKTGKDIESSEVGAEIGAEANLSLQSNWASRLELLAWKTDENTARVEFRKARQGNSKIRAGVSVFGNIMDRDSAITALSELLAFRVDAVERRVELIQSELHQVMARVDQKWSGIALDVDVFGDADSAVSKAVGTVASRMDRRFRIDVKEMLGFGEKVARIDRAVDEFAGKLNLNDRIEEMAGKLGDAIDSIDIPDLPRSQRNVVAAIAGLTGYKKTTPGLLASFLSVPSYREKLVSAIDSKKLSLPDAEVLRSELLRKFEELPFASFLEQDEIELLSLVKKTTGYSLADIASNFSSRRILESVVPDGSIVSLKGILEKIQDFSPLEVIFPTKLEKYFLKAFGGSLGHLPAKIDEAVERIATAVSSEIQASAQFEFSRKKSAEALFSFDFKLDEDDASEELGEIYKQLLRGNLDFALEKYRKDKSAGAYFDALDFYAAKEIEKRASFRLRVLSSRFEQDGTSYHRELEKIDGGFQQHLSVEANYHGKWKELIGKGEREWGGYWRLDAESKGFLSSEKFIREKMNFSLEAGISWSGNVKQSGSHVNTRPGNWKMLSTFAGMYDSNRLAGSDPMTPVLKRLASKSNKERLITLELNLTMGPQALEALWSAVPDAFEKAYRRKWKGIAKVRGTKIAMTTNEKANFNQYLSALDSLAEGVNSSSIKVGKLLNRMEWWRFCSNRSGSGGRKLDKFCYFITLLALLPVNDPHTKLGGTLELDGERIYFG